MSETETDGPPRAVLIAALVVAVVAIGVILGIAATRKPADTPVAISSVPAPHAGDPACNALLDAVPEELGDFRRAKAVDPVPQGTAAWRSAPGTDPVILRCGLDRPGDFVIGTPIQQVDDVQWFRVSDPASGLITWFAVDRGVYVALTLPQDSGPTPIQDISGVISSTMPAKPLDPGPAS
ncbi:DUF3515 domain-containing protein [soil metagenome]